MRQNVEQVESLLFRRTPLETVEQPRPIRAFQRAPATEYTIGQWVDVKDTIDQWLEAQVTKVQPDRVFIHFNGWGSRWDEWISKDSPRISPFRAHTVQSPHTPFLSPYPHIDPDAEDHEIPPDSTTYEDLLIRYCTRFSFEDPE